MKKREKLLRMEKEIKNHEPRRDTSLFFIILLSASLCFFFLLLGTSNRGGESGSKKCQKFFFSSSSSSSSSSGRGPYQRCREVPTQPVTVVCVCEIFLFLFFFFYSMGNKRMGIKKKNFLLLDLLFSERKKKVGRDSTLEEMER